MSGNYLFLGTWQKVCRYNLVTKEVKHYPMLEFQEILIPSSYQTLNPNTPMTTSSTSFSMTAVILFLLVPFAIARDTNQVFEPCADTTVQRFDGFTFGIAFASKDSFFFNQTQLSPCDRRLSFSSAQVAVFRPKVDEISLLTINTTASPSVNTAGFMVAFAGRKYAARSLPAFVGNSSFSVTSFTLVLEFQKGTLQNLYWKRDGCASCTKNSNFVCLNNQNCAVKTSSCKNQNQGGSIDCSIGIQTAFSGTDKHQVALNSWYEVSKIGQYSLFGLYSNLRGSLSDQFNKFF